MRLFCARVIAPEDIRIVAFFFSPLSLSLSFDSVGAFFLFSCDLKNWRFLSNTHAQGKVKKRNVDFKRERTHAHTHAQSNKTKQMADKAPQSAEELTTFVQSMLTQMQSRFQQMSDEIITKIDDLGNRIEELDEQVQKMSDLSSDEKGNEKK
jgi:heat shock factor-binding protein 1